MQQIESSAKFSHKLVKPLVAIAVFISVFAAAWLIDHAYRVREVNVSGVSRGKAIFGLEALQGSSMLTQSEEAYITQIKNTNPTLSSVSVVKIYPSTLKVSVAFTKPISALRVNNGYFMLDEMSRIVEKQTASPSGRLPEIVYYQQFSGADYELGAELSAPDLKAALFFLKKLQSLGIAINSIDIDGFHMLGLYGGDIAYIFSVEKDTKLQAYQLEQVIKKLKLEGAEYKKLDFRFEKPVLTL